MVSLWPWKGDDNSPASFEKTLATLSDKHKQTTTRLDGYRQQARRFKALWTLYSIFIYLLYSTIDVLVLGRQNWGYWEYGAVLGGPFVIYIVRTVASRIFDYRISRTQSQLDSLNKQRDETIEKLKVATKYNSTQQLLDKYGGDSPSPDKSKTAAAAAAAAGAKKPKRKDASDTEQQQFKAAFTSGRTGIPPPPTANIRRPSPNEAFLSPPPPNNNYNYYLEGKPLPPPPSSEPYNEQASFAPNAFPPSQAQYDKTGGAGIGGPKWYDRLMDVLLGEDEASAKNRIVLICQNCRLVNGQAPPGVKRLDELGRWRCGGCGAWNGEESEAKKVLDSIQQTSSTAAAAASGDREEKEVEEAAKSEQQQEHEEEEHGEESDSEQAVKQEDEIGDDKSDGSGRGDAESSGVSTRTRSRRAKK